MSTDTRTESATGPQPPQRPAAHPGRAWLLVLGIGLGVLSILSGVGNIVGSIGRDSVTRSETFSGVRVVDVDVSAEDVQIEAGPDDATRLDRSISWSLGRPTITQQLDGDRLVVRSSCHWWWGRGCSGRVHLTVPASVQVVARSSGGWVGVTGLSGDLDLESSAAHVDGRMLTSATVRAQSSAGDVDVRFAAPPSRVSAQSSAGDTVVLVPHDTELYRVTASSSAGSTEVLVRSDPSADRRIDAGSSAGDVTVGYDR
jgi:hypothetical protein